MDININIDGHNFNLRVCAFIYNKDKSKILITGMKNRDFYILPGGRVQLDEYSKDAIEREIKEELGWDLEYNFKYFSENFVNVKDMNAHQILICYESIYDGEVVNEFMGLEGDFNTYYWVNVNDIDSYNIKPKLTREIISSSGINMVSREY